MIDTVYEALRRRWPQSARRRRKATPAEVATRMLALKHIRNWSFDTLEREVRADMVYRMFTRVGDEKLPDAKTLARIECALGPEIIEKIHGRIVVIAQEERSSKVRGYGWKRQSPKLIFIIRPIAACWATACADADDETDRQDRSGCGRAGAEPDAQWQSSRDGIARASRSKIQERSKKRLQESYKQLLHSTGQVVAQAKRIAQEVDNGVKKEKNRIDQVRLEE